MIGLVIAVRGFGAAPDRALRLADHVVHTLAHRDDGCVTLIDSDSVRTQLVADPPPLQWQAVSGALFLDPYDSGELDRARLRGVLRDMPTSEALCLDLGTFWVELVDEVAKELADALFSMQREYRAVALVCDDFVAARAVESMLSYFWLPSDVQADKLEVNASLKTGVLSRILRYLGDGLAYRVLFKLGAGLKGWLDRLRR